MSRRARPSGGAAAVLAALALAPALAGCGGGDEPAAKVPVAASFFPLAEAAREIGGERVAVTDLTPVGGQPHDLVPSAEAVKALRASRVALFLGQGGFQPAVEQAVAALPARTAKIDLLDGQELLPPAAPIPGERGAVDGAGEGADPHAWVDPRRFARMAARVRDALIAADPDGREDYDRRARAYVARLEALGNESAQLLAGCAQRVLVTAHPAFAYLVENTGVTQAVTAGISAAAEPDPRSLAALGRWARAQDDRPTTLWFSTPVPSRTARAIETATGLDAGTLNPVEGLTVDQQEAGATYESLTRDNLSALAQGLSCTAAAPGEEPGTAATGPANAPG